MLISFVFIVSYLVVLSTIFYHKKIGGVKFMSEVSIVANIKENCIRKI